MPQIADSFLLLIQAPCSIPSNLSKARVTACGSVIGSITVYFDKDAQTIRDFEDDILLHIRTNMAMGAYESPKIRKVIYVEQLNTNPPKSNSSSPFNTDIELHQAAEHGNKSLVIAITFSLLLAFLAGVFIFTSKRRRPMNQRVEDVPNEEVSMSMSITANECKTALRPQELQGQINQTSSSFENNSEIYGDAHERADDTDEVQSKTRRPDHEALGFVVRLVLSALN